MATPKYPITIKHGHPLANANTVASISVGSFVSQSFLIDEAASRSGDPPSLGQLNLNRNPSCGKLDQLDKSFRMKRSTNDSPWEAN